MESFKAVRHVSCTGQAWMARAAMCCVLLHGGAAPGQTLDQEYDRLLRNSCREMGFTRIGGPGGPLVEGQAGANLEAFCNLTITTQGNTTDTSLGGSAWSASAQDQVSDLAERRRKARDGSAMTTPETQLATLGQTSIFLSFDYGREDRGTTTYEPGQVSRTLDGVLGVDRRFGSAGLVGAAIHYQRLEGDTDAGGDFAGKSAGLWVYGSLWPAENLFLDMALSIDKGSLRTRRIVGREYRRTILVPGDAPQVEITYAPPLAPVDSKPRRFDFSWDWRAGQDLNYGGLTMGPRVGVSIKYSRLDDYVESGDSPMTLRFDKRQVTSLQSLAGLQAGWAIPAPRFSLLPQLAVDWVHEYGNDQQRLTATFAEDLRGTPARLTFLGSAPDRNWWVWRASVAARFGRLAGFLAYQQIAGHAFIDRYQASLGLRLEL